MTRLLGLILIGSICIESTFAADVTCSRLFSISSAPNGLATLQAEGSARKFQDWFRTLGNLRDPVQRFSRWVADTSGLFRVNSATDDLGSLRQAAKYFLPDVPEAEAVEILRAQERQAQIAMFRLLPKSHFRSTEPLLKWLGDYQKLLECEQRPLISWVNALIFGLRSGLFEKMGINAEGMAQVRQLLRSSREKFLDEALPSELTDEKLTARLPRRALARFASRKEILYHNAIYAEGNLGIFGRIVQTSRNFIPLPQDVVTASLFMTVLISNTSVGSQIMAGLMEGYLFSSLVEYYAHSIVGHSSRSDIAAMKAVSSELGSAIENWTIAHGQTHHSEFSKNLVDSYGDFDPSDPNYEAKTQHNRDKAAVVLDKARSRTDDLDRTLLRSKGGSRFGEPLFNAFIALPFSAALAYTTHVITSLFGLDTGPAFFGPELATSVMFIGSVNWYHIKMHVPGQTMIEQADPISRWFMNTRVARAGVRKHLLHHLHGNDERTISPGPLDIALGTNHDATYDELLLLEWQGALY